MKAFAHCTRRSTLAALLIWTAACTASAHTAKPPTTAPTTAVDTALAQIQADVNFLASPKLRGRAAGSTGGAQAATYFVKQYAALSLAGAFEDCTISVTCGRRFYQNFDIGTARARNVGVIIEGTDSVLRKQYVVIGAHYDHIGTSSVLSLDPERGAVIRPGADDNASGSAAVLELVRRLRAHPPRRSILVLHFDGEELGLLGSEYFVRHLPVPRSSMVLMVNLDMVGRLRKNELIIDKTALGLGARELRVLVDLDSTAHSYGISIKTDRKTEGRSDHASFEHIIVPAIELFTGLHADYHTASDVASKVNIAGIKRVVDIAESVIRASANRD